MAIDINSAGVVPSSLAYKGKQMLDPKTHVNYIIDLEPLRPYLPDYAIVVVEHEPDLEGTLWQMQPTEEEGWLQLNITGNAAMIDDTLSSDTSVYSSLYTDTTFAKKSDVYSKTDSDTKFGLLEQQTTNTSDIATLKEKTDSLSSAMRFRGSVATYGELLLLEDPQVGDFYLIDQDETREFANTKYIYNGTNWIFNGINEIKTRDFELEPINLGEEQTLPDGTTKWVSEVKGKLRMQDINLDLSAENVSYDNDEFSTVKEALDSLLYKALTITFSSSSPTTLERGRAILNPQFSWGYNKAITQQNINGTVIPNDDRTFTYNGTVNSNTTFTLSASDEKKTYTKAISFTYYDAIYFGSSADGTYDEAFVEALSGKELKGSAKGTSYTVNCADGEYIFFAIPNVLANGLIFSCGGFDGGFAEMSTVTVENQYGVQCDYVIFKSDNHSLGNTTITIK